MVFSEDNTIMLIQNLSIQAHNLMTSLAGDCKVLSNDERLHLYYDITGASEMLCMYSNRFSEQFVHNSRIRRVCPNENCKSKYAYFYEDFLYCPKCGTMLKTTRDDREEDQHAD